MPRSLVGKLLVASPILEDPNFARSVVLICTHDHDGAFGLVLNRPLSAPVHVYLPDWTGPLAEPGVVFGGGPVDVTSAFGLARGRAASVDAWASPPIAQREQRAVGLVDLDRADELVSLGVEEFRVYSGYAGWVGGQLEGELLGEAWFIVDALPGDPFTPNPERLWHEVLGRQRGDLAMFRHFPEDPSLN